MKDFVLHPLINEPDKILQKKPFTRGGGAVALYQGNTSPHDTKEVTSSSRMLNIITQDRYLAELDPSMHDIHFDTNVPSIVAKVQLNNKSFGYAEIQDKKMALAYQRKIAQKQTIYLTGKPMKLSMFNNSPSDELVNVFISIKEEWESKNMNIHINNMVYQQKTTGDAAMLFYFDKNNKIQSKVYSYEDGYTLLPHYNAYGNLDLFALYYIIGDTERLDCYDDSTLTTLTRRIDEEWKVTGQESHQFHKIPVVYKRGKVAWEDAQSTIGVLEVIYNTYAVIMKRHGWGLLYIRGNFDENMRKLAGAVILNDPNPESNGTAEFKSPPTPDGMENLIKDLRQQIQWQSSTIFLQPEEVKLGSQPSGIAVKLLMHSAIEQATQDALTWDEVADQICDLFIYGLGKERSEYTAYKNLKIRAQFEVWVPQSDAEISSNISLLSAAGAISKRTSAETNPYAKPDEYNRILLDIKTETDTNNGVD